MLVPRKLLDEVLADGCSSHLRLELCRVMELPGSKQVAAEGEVRALGVSLGALCGSSLWACVEEALKLKMAIKAGL